MADERAKKILDFLARRIGYKCVKQHGLGATYMLERRDGGYTRFWYDKHIIVECRKKYKDFLFALIDLSMSGYSIQTCNY